jgi:hypothetical protein
VKNAVASWRSSDYFDFCASKLPPLFLALAKRPVDALRIDQVLDESFDFAVEIVARRDPCPVFFAIVASLATDVTWLCRRWAAMSLVWWLNDPSGWSWMATGRGPIS